MGHLLLEVARLLSGGLLEPLVGDLLINPFGFIRIAAPVCSGDWLPD